MTEILLVSDGFFHPPFFARRSVREALEAVPGCHFTQVGQLDALAEQDLEQYQAIVLYYHHKEAQPGAFFALEKFVQNGGGILAVHSATASFKDQSREERGRYFEILGGRFAGHGPVESFAIRPVDEVDGAFKGILPFMVKDELYMHDLQPDIKVQFFTPYKGGTRPVVWTREEGGGRVCYVSPGHRTETMQQPQMQEVLRRGLLWVMQQQAY